MTVVDLRSSRVALRGDRSCGTAYPWHNRPNDMNCLLDAAQDETCDRVTGGPTHHRAPRRVARNASHNGGAHIERAPECLAARPTVCIMSEAAAQATAATTHQARHRVLRVCQQPLIRTSPFCSGSWSCPTARRGQWPEAAFAANCARPCRVGGSDAARGSPAPSARTGARRRAARPGLWLSFVPHLRYKEPYRLFPFPHRLVHAVSA